MAMGICSTELFDSELISLGIVKPVSVTEIESNKGRNGSHAVPESLRAVIAEEKINGASASELSEIFDVSKSSISAYANGATSTTSYQEGNKELRNKNNIIRERIISKARKRLISALDNITEDKLAEAKLKDVSSVARDMASVINNITPKLEPHQQVNIDKVMIYKPRLREEDTYDVIEVND